MIAGLLLTSGNLFGLAVLALSCTGHADGAAPVPLSVTIPDQTPAEAQPSRGRATDTAEHTTSRPAARTAHTRACRCGSHPRPTT
ncbi:hypothetical protein ABZ891_22975 [Streptomyces sp. NPDC047023]|uniref:hypothetical protein n=1 Tax=Streptomyces sp. NPDC047023 TaxID=3155139 RepID=UPI0033E9510A